ncbi:MAG: FxsA family protein [Thiohalomonadales bacterium]
MNPFSLLLLIFLLVPIVEIYLLIQVGGVIGALPTVVLVVFTAVMGAWLIRIQGISTLQRVRKTVAEGGIPAFEVLEGLMLLVAGALLLTPGFFTDTIGFLFLMPALRRLLLIWLSSRFMVSGHRAATNDEVRYEKKRSSQSNTKERVFPHENSHDDKPNRHKSHVIIEGEYKREDDKKHKP